VEAFKDINKRAADDHSSDRARTAVTDVNIDKLNNC
jgi:hypothetical protein